MRSNSEAFDPSIYDKGILSNLQHVLGANPLTWLLPLRKTEEFKKTAIYEKRKRRKRDPEYCNESSDIPTDPKEPLLNKQVYSL